MSGNGDGDWVQSNSKQLAEDPVEHGGGEADVDEFVSAEGGSAAEEAVDLPDDIDNHHEDVFEAEDADRNGSGNEARRHPIGRLDDGSSDGGSEGGGESSHDDNEDEMNEQNEDDNENDVDDDDDDDDEEEEEEEEQDDDEEEEDEGRGREAQELGNLISQGNSVAVPGPGCSHYRRGCALIAPCCNKRYACRHCHNESEQHEINRFAISEVVCLACDRRQPITDNCIDCNALFGNYVCLKCRVWDMDFKGQWHCDGCGICRLGGKDHFFHCDRCGYCLSVALRGDHRCIERATRTGCAICLADLHDTRTPLVVPACGHPVHRSCWRQMIDSRRYFCPTCRRAVVDLTDIWADLDTRIGDQLNRLPAEFCLPIFCNDCQQHSSVRYNIIGYFKCPGCGSYNTQR